MNLALLGCALLVLALFIGWWWLLIVGLVLMLVGAMIYDRPQDDPVWKQLRMQGVIDEHGDSPRDNTERSMPSYPEDPLAKINIDPLLTRGLSLC